VPYLKPYKHLNRLIQNESFEPLLSWGMRMALAGTVPIIWGLFTGNISDAIWIALTAEGISWIELKGSFKWRAQTLVSGAILSFIFAFIGTVTAPSLLFSVIGMFVVGFLATMLKNIGDRASGLAICVYLLYIICNAYPTHSGMELSHRMAVVAIGAVWPIVVGLSTSLFMPAEQPFRRQIALIWRSVSELIYATSRIDNRAGFTKTLADVYKKEKEVRAAIDNSYQFYSRMAHEVSKKDTPQYQLFLLRKNAGLVAVNIIAMGEEMELIDIRKLDKAIRIKAATLFSAMQEAVSRIAIYTISLKPEEKLIALSHINRLKKLTVLIREYGLPPGDKSTMAINRILQLTDRLVKLLESAIQRIDLMGKDKPVFQSYSMIKTLFVLRPEYLLSNIKTLFNFNSFNIRYAFRSAIAATFALLVYKWFNIGHGYWMPFSVMIVIQPYFGATFKKAMERVVGTVLGGLVGGLLLHFPPELHLNEIILFITFVLMVYFVRKNYAIAVFIITLNLVLLFNIEATYSNMLMIVRGLSTIAGCALAVISVYALLPTWDKKWLPAHLADAVKCNYDYFIATFFAPARIANWTKSKRSVESKNSNVFDSFNRYLQEPGKEKYNIYYDLVTYNVRITRNLNNIHMEQDEKKNAETLPATDAQQQKIDECAIWFNKIVAKLSFFNPSIEVGIHANDKLHHTPFLLNAAQQTSLEKLLIELKTMHDEMAQWIKEHS
jgi:hypothetical protein